MVIYFVTQSMIASAMTSASRQLSNYENYPG
jgi:hypothetical protein